jgi:hypothetical protein
MSRFQTLRTRLVFTDDGWPLQSLSAKGQIALEVYEAGDSDPVRLARQVYDEYVTRPFDYVNDWPVRMAVVCRRDVPAQLVAVMNHLATDGQGSMVMLDEVRRRAESPVDGMQPLEQSRWQGSPAGIRQNEAAMRHFARQLARIPPGVLEGAHRVEQPRYRKGKLRSEALWLALRALAARTGVDSSAILIALYALGFAKVTGHEVFFTRPVVSNRFRPGLSNVVCNVAQAGLCVVEVAGRGVDEVIVQARKAAMTAYKYAYFDPRRLSELIAETAGKRGPSFSAGCFFNDRRRPGHCEPAEVVPNLAEAARKPAAFRWVPEREKICDRLFLCVEDVPGLIELTVDFDTKYVSSRTAEAILRAVEEVALAALADPYHKI